MAWVVCECGRPLRVETTCECGKIAPPKAVTIYCEKCGDIHIDEGEWATPEKAHKTHQCQTCKHEWKPFPYATVGVDDFGHYP